MNLTDLLENWRTEPTIRHNITAWHTTPARSAQTAPLPAGIHPLLAKTLAQQGITTLYTHQAETWQQVQAGRHPVIVTGTASGKTLAFNLPVLNWLLTDPKSRALYLFPTKALAYDQLTRLKSEFGIPPLVTATYDGDTPASARPAIRRRANIILSNPDMLHTAILPHHTGWSQFFSRLQFVVIDEMHTYRGVFGSHVANVIRRLKRVALFYGAAPQFILTSATLANPGHLARQLIEEDSVLVSDDGSAYGPRHFIIYNPPVVNQDLGVRRGALQESIRLANDLLHANVQTIIFGRTRRTVELLLTYLREKLPINLDKQTVRAYRSGYLPRQRREIEQGLRSGHVKVVAATSALELGIDIGGLGAAIIAGYPGTIAATWQQAGRAGRANEAALAVLVASGSPLDQFLAHHPAYFFERSPEQARINPDNLLILLQHLRCAAFELPFDSGEPFGGVAPEKLAEFFKILESSGEMYCSNEQYFWMADKYPANQVSLRAASPDNIKLLVRKTHGTPADSATEPEARVTIGEVNLTSAPAMVHPQAVYLHEGQSFLIEALKLDEGIAELRPANVDYYTLPIQNATLTLIEQLDHTAVAGGRKYHGEIQVTSQVTGYKMIQYSTRQTLGVGEVTLPPTDLVTTGYWLALPPQTVDGLRQQGLWTNDPNNYGPDWPKQRNAARSRDGFTCQLCGRPESRQQHHVHHKIPFRQFTNYRQANQLSNLVTLCPACHRQAEKSVQTRSGLGGLATILGHLAPLFLMCDTHDIGTHADPKSPLTGGNPTIVIYDMIPAGIGFSEQLYGLHHRLIDQAHKLVSTCPCQNGCPSCVGPAGEDGIGGKWETLAILQTLKS
jgi:DEAD/DEAH box helicase domain-containing protein